MLVEPQCFKRNCKHFQGATDTPDEMTQELKCAAFPKGPIPAEIAYGDNLHLDPFPGDNGVNYEPAN